MKNEAIEEGLQERCTSQVLSSIVDELAKPDLLRNGSLDPQCAAIAAAVKEGLRTAIAEQDELIGYSELARRMRLKEKFVRHLKNAGIIHALACFPDT